ncbi:conjugal transfer protein TrbJ [Acidithiobacillus ferrivorans]|nr:conjugal transfer protein TrbJ [Acidithiobacillus ferrivorans]
MHNHKSPLIAGIALAILFLSPSAFAVSEFAGATFPQQIVQEMTAIESQTTQAQTLVSNLQRYENMAQNMVTLPQSMMNQIMQPIDQLYGLVGQAQGLSTNAENIANQFQNMNAYFNPQVTAQYTQNYQSISNGLSNAINTALQSANLNPNSFTQQAQAQKAISTALANPNSRNALLQGAVAAGQATVSSLTQLQQAVDAENTAEMAWKKAQLEGMNANANAISSFLGNTMPSAQETIPPLSGNAINRLSPSGLN